MTAHLPDCCDCVVLLYKEDWASQIVRFIVVSICIYPCVSLWDYCCHSLFCVLFSYLITPFHRSHIVNMHPHFSPFSLVFLLLRTLFHHQTPSSSLFPSHPPFHSSFSSCFHLRRFTLNVLNVDRWGFPAPPLGQNLKNEVWLYVCVFADVCLCDSVLVYMALCEFLCS